MLIDEHIAMIVMGLNPLTPFHGFHEFAQLNVAKLLADAGYLTYLETAAFKVQDNGKRKYCGETDVTAVMGGITYAWEVKPITTWGSKGNRSESEVGTDRQEAFDQLDKYLINGVQEGFRISISDITFWRDIKMKIESDILRPGVVYYSFYKENTRTGEQEEVSTVYVQKVVERDIAIVVGIVGTVMVATLALDVVTLGADIYNDIASLMAALKLAQWALSFG